MPENPMETPVPDTPGVAEEQNAEPEVDSESGSVMGYPQLNGILKEKGYPAFDLSNEESYEEGLTNDEAAKRLVDFGHNELPDNSKNKWLLLAENFWGPMPCMIWITIIVELAGVIKASVGGVEGALGPNEHGVDVGILLALQFMNALVGWHEEMKAGDAVAELASQLAPEANVKRDGKWIVVKGRDLVPGDLVGLSLGGAVPADCTLLKGREIRVDQAALTGESLPVAMEEGDTAKMGSNVTNGEIEAIVTATGLETFFGKTAALLSSVEGKSNLEKILDKTLVIICTVGAPMIIIIIAILSVRGYNALEIITEVVVLIVAIVPIANAVVCTSTLAFGARELSEDGAIVTRLSSIEEMAGMNVLCSDKTGTLTLNKMVMQQICVCSDDGKAEEFDYPDETGIEAENTASDVLLYASLAAKWKETPKDALDTLTLNATKPRREELDSYAQLDYEPFDPAIKRTCAHLRNNQGEEFWATKGAPNIVLQMCHNYAKIGPEVEELTEDFASRGIRCIGVARTVPGDLQKWQFSGLLTFLDPPRPDTADTIANAHKLAVKVKMITGDHLAIAKETCRVLGMGTHVHGTDMLPHTAPEALLRLGELGPICEEADGFAGVFPEHKFMIVEILQERGWICGMTGDGVNDAPALKKADVGVAVQGATDAARAAADIVLTNPGLSTIVKAIRLSRIIFQRVKNYLIYRVTSSFMLGVFFAISVGISLTPHYTGCAAFNAQPGQLDVPATFNFPSGPVSASDVSAAFGTPSPTARDRTFTTMMFPICRPGCKNTPENRNQQAAFLEHFGSCPHYLLQPSEKETYGIMHIAGKTYSLNGTKAEWASGLGPINHRSQPVDPATDPIEPLTWVQDVAAMRYTNWRGQVQGDIQGNWYDYSGQVASGMTSSGHANTNGVARYMWDQTSYDQYGCLLTCEAAGPGESPVDYAAIPMNNYFVLTILQLVLMIIFNDGCMITVAWDTVKPSPVPKKWDLDQLVALTSVMAVIVTGGQILFLWIIQDALPLQGFYRFNAVDAVDLLVTNLNLDPDIKVGSGLLNVFQIWFSINQQFLASQQQALMYVSLSWAGFLTLMAARTEWFFWESMPAPQLMMAMGFSMIATVFFGGFFKVVTINFMGATPNLCNCGAGEWYYILVAALYNIWAFFMLDAGKVMMLMWIRHNMGEQQEIDAHDFSEVKRNNRIQLAQSAYEASLSRAISEGTHRQSEKRNAGGISEIGTSLGFPFDSRVTTHNGKEVLLGIVTIHKAGDENDGQAALMRDPTCKELGLELPLPTGLLESLEKDGDEVTLDQIILALQEAVEKCDEPEKAAKKEAELARVEKFLEKIEEDEDGKHYHAFSTVPLQVELKGGSNTTVAARYLEWKSPIESNPTAIKALRLTSHSGAATTSARLNSIRSSTSKRTPGPTVGRIDPTASAIVDPVLRIANKVMKLGEVTQKLVDKSGDEETEALMAEYSMV